VLDEGAKNVKLAGKRHPVTGIVFDERGFPIFDGVAEFDTRIANDVVSVMDRDHHMIAATAQLDEAIQRAEVGAMKFSQEQLAAIRAHKARVPGYIWHHHQHRGRMQLVPRDIHDATGHAGGFKTWYER